MNKLLQTIEDKLEKTTDKEIDEVINYAIDNVFIIAELTFILGGADKVNTVLKELIKKYKEDNKDIQDI